MLFGAVTPPFLLVWWLTSTNVAGMFLAVSIGYFLLYEWLHFIYHVPAHHWIGRRRVVTKLRELHQAHHNKALMTRYNFNITFPICDYLFGTLYRSSVVGDGHPTDIEHK